MNYRQLLELARSHEWQPIEKSQPMTFSSGAKWMHDQLEQIRNKPIVFHPKLPYERAGIIKYGLSMSGMMVAAIGLWAIYPLLVPLSIVVFYLLEVQFLFLFPFLIDHSSHPFRASRAAIRRIGTLRALYVVLPIGVWMVLGLLRLHQPLRNWYLGCLAILIWYEHEVGDRA